MAESQADKLDEISKKLDRIINMMLNIRVPDPGGKFEQILQAQASLSREIEALRKQLAAKDEEKT